jgi:hypothetical protein
MNGLSIQGLAGSGPEHPPTEDWSSDMAGVQKQSRREIHFCEVMGVIAA